VPGGRFRLWCCHFIAGGNITCQVMHIFKLSAAACGWIQNDYFENTVKTVYNEPCTKQKIAHSRTFFWSHELKFCIAITCEPGQHSWYSDWSPGMVKNFLFSMSSRLSLGPTQPPIQWVEGTLSPGVKRPGREADPSPPTSAKIKKTWIYICTPTYVFLA
jgi:hypothetical protein